MLSVDHTLHDLHYFLYHTPATSFNNFSAYSEFIILLEFISCLTPTRQDS